VHAVIAQHMSHEAGRPEYPCKRAVADAQAPGVGAERGHHRALAVGSETAPLADFIRTAVAETPPPRPSPAKSGRGGRKASLGEKPLRSNGSAVDCSCHSPRPTAPLPLFALSDSHISKTDSKTGT
jgi:hypothetical protein